MQPRILFKNLFQINDWDRIFIYDGLLATAHFLCFHPDLEVRRAMLAVDSQLGFALASDTPNQTMCGQLGSPDL
jgi:hypothetical protein